MMAGIAEVINDLVYYFEQNSKDRDFKTVKNLPLFLEYYQKKYDINI
jgi:hypothetical protein